MMRVAAVGLLVVMAVAAPARADTPPNVWDVARDPESRDLYALHVSVRESMLMDAESNLPSAIRHAPLMRARAMLEDAGAATSPDVRLRFDLGEVYARQQNYPRAIEVLRAALAMAPDHPAAVRAYETLASAYANLDESTSERAVYEAYLARETDERARAIAMLNLAEAEMHLGNLAEAAAEYREAIQVAAQLPNMIELETNTGLLAVWGLAVALDRAGDESGGAKEARLAEQLDANERIIRNGSNVFFVPRYERLWYLALGATDRAKRASSAKESAERWSAVEAYWRAYVDRAAPTDRWLGQARAHRERATATRIAAQKRAGVPIRAPGALVWADD